MFKIRKAEVEDLSTIQTLGRETFVESYSEFNTKEDMDVYLERSFSEETVMNELQDKNTEFYLCLLDNAPIGYIKLNYGKACEVLNERAVTELQRIYVLKRYQNKKAGKALLEYAVKICKSRGDTFLWLGVWKENAKANAFYFSKGFEIVGERSFTLGSRICEDYYLSLSLL